MQAQEIGESFDYLAFFYTLIALNSPLQLTSIDFSVNIIRYSRLFFFLKYASSLFGSPKFCMREGVLWEQNELFMLSAQARSVSL